MCPPKYYNVDYEINPHMEGNVNKVDTELAKEQWTTFFNLLSQYAIVQLVKPIKGLPDMVFTANAGTYIPVIDTFIVSSFFHPERQGESLHFRNYAQEYMNVSHLVDFSRKPQPFLWEGDGDVIRDGNTQFVGCGSRSRLEGHLLVEKLWKTLDGTTKTEKVDTIILFLRDPRFYHLDTCFSVIKTEKVTVILYYPDAFSPNSVRAIKEYGVRNNVVVLPITEAEAMMFTCNNVQAGKGLFFPLTTQRIVDLFEAFGFEVHTLNFSEFLKAGGAARCLTLNITRQPK